ncbi:MAG: transcriptional repressor [Firmicutes bacterium]|nr:transcriptional repressor [Bacillota bacterium]
MKKHSQKRQAIRAALDGVTSHPTASEVYDMVRADYPNISLATVYRNLTEFDRDGTANMLYIGDGTVHFDGNAVPHDHFVCDKCGRVIDVAKGSELLSGEICGNRIERCSVLYYGTCRDCVNDG